MHGKKLAELPHDEAARYFEETIRSRLPLSSPDIRFFSDGQILSAHRYIQFSLEDDLSGAVVWSLWIDVGDLDGGCRYVFTIGAGNVRHFKTLDDAIAFIQDLGRSLTQSNTVPTPRTLGAS